MFLTVHASAGIYIGTVITNPWLAFILAIISHLILDAVPHGDENIGKETDKKKKIIKLSIIAFVDTLGVVILYYFLTSYFITPSPAIILGIIGSIMPDYLWGVYELTKNKILGWISIHILSYFHNILHTRVSLPVGMLIQALTLLFFITLVIL